VIRPRRSWVPRIAWRLKPSCAPVTSRTSDSNIREGATYALPTAADYAASTGEAGQAVTLDETGHAYDADLKMASESSAFKAAYDADASTFDPNKNSEFYYMAHYNPTGYLS
jgi:hypothetical protein